MITIGVLPGNVNSEHVLQVLQGVYSAADQYGIKIVSFMGIQPTDYDRSLVDSEFGELSHDYQAGVIYDYAVKHRIDALIINYSMVSRFMSEMTRRSYQELFEKIPVVFVDEYSPIENGMSVTTENYNAEYNLTAHLIRDHHRKHITVLAGPKGNIDAEERLRAVKQCCSDMGMSLMPSQVAYGDFSPSVTIPMERLLADNPDLDALIAGNDEMADSAISFLKEHGYKVGQDVSVVGFDDDLSIAPFCDVPLTTAFQDACKIGRKAVEIIIDKSSKKSIIGAEIVYRASCGCAFEKEDIDYLSGGGRLVQARFRTMHERSMQMLTFAREMINHVHYEKQFFMIAAKQLKRIGCRGAWLAILEHPILHHRDEEWISPDRLSVKFALENDDIIFYENDECPEIATDNGDSDIIPEKYSKLSVLPMYSEEYQYGIMIADIDISNLFYLFLATLQIVFALEYRRISLEKDERNRWLQIASQTDSMTNTLNRQGFNEMASYSIRNGNGRKMRFYFADMDHLKQINDTFGHNEGDYAIVVENSLLKRAFFKQSQIIARYGGDEFVILDTEPGHRSPEEVIKRLKEYCQAFNRSSNKPYCIEISCGCVEFTADDSTDIREVIAAADKALYEDKKSRRNSAVKD